MDIVRKVLIYFVNLHVYQCSDTTIFQPMRFVALAPLNKNIYLHWENLTFSIFCNVKNKTKTVHARWMAKQRQPMKALARYKSFSKDKRLLGIKPTVYQLFGGVLYSLTHLISTSALLACLFIAGEYANLSFKNCQGN